MECPPAWTEDPPGVGLVPAPASSATTTGLNGTQKPVPNPQSAGTLVCGPRKGKVLFSQRGLAWPVWEQSRSSMEIEAMIRHQAWQGPFRTERTRAQQAGARAGGVQEGCLEEGARGKAGRAGGAGCPTGPALVLAWSSPQGNPDSWPFWEQQWPAFKFQLSQPEWPAGVRTGAPTPSLSPARHIPASPEVASPLPGGRECGAQWPGTRAH